jgi:outer membrane protein assembly factor BamE (lipoprotein component of BamABCDE complex)
MTLPSLSRPARWIMTLICAAALSACAAVKEDRGYIFDPNDLAKIQAGATSKDQVREIMGSPSTVSTVEGEAWYYISSKFETFAFYRPKETERTVAAIFFEKTDVVQDIAYYGMDDGQIVAFVERKTPTRGKELTILGQLFSNLGKYNQSSALPSVGTGNPTGRR